MLESFEPHDLERLRRSIAMLRPEQPAGLKREDATRLIAELQRLQQAHQENSDWIRSLRGLIDDLPA